jgi:hypothetical protein
MRGFLSQKKKEPDMMQLLAYAVSTFGNDVVFKSFPKKFLLNYLTESDGKDYRYEKKSGWKKPSKDPHICSPFDLESVDDTSLFYSVFQ